jgi:hypothetical protein
MFFSTKKMYFISDWDGWLLYTFLELSVEYVGMKCLSVVVGKTPQIVSVFQLEHLLVLDLLNILLSMPIHVLQYVFHVE